MAKERTELCLTGTGGQGLILAGVILGEAATLFDGKNAIQTQSYGPEARGGASRAEVVISDTEIFYPKTMEIDILMALSQQALDKYNTLVRKGGLFIVDNTYIKEIPAACENVFQAPFTEMAISKLGKAIVTNIIATSSLVAITKVVSREAFTKAVEDRVPPKALELNRKAIEIGYQLVADQNFTWNK